jgi:hypothetical protein
MASAGEPWTEAETAPHSMLSGFGNVAGSAGEFAAEMALLHLATLTVPTVHADAIIPL